MVRERYFLIQYILTINVPIPHPFDSTHHDSNTARQLGPKPLKIECVRHHKPDHFPYCADCHPTQSPNQFHGIKNPQYNVGLDADDEISDS